MLLSVILQVATLFFASTIYSEATPVEKYVSGDNKDYDAALKFLEQNDVRHRKIINKQSNDSWNYETDLTEENLHVVIETQEKMAKFIEETQKIATSFAWKDFKSRNETVYRWFKSLARLGIAALPEDKLDEFYDILADMDQVYAEAKVCPKDNPDDKPCELSLEPELVEIFQKSRDYDELQHLWVEWRKETNKVRSEYLEYVKLSNEAAELNGYNDAGDMWRDSYESDTFLEDVEELWKEIEPIYLQIHAFVRRRLIDQYPDKVISPDGPIPAHLLGNMWAQSWSNLFDIVKPFPEKKSTDVSERMVQKKMTALDMFKMSDEFFTSLGLYPMTPEFWNRSIIEKPTDRKIICHPSAWDFFDGEDFRIKMCTRISLEDLIIIHREMGHVQYYQQYAHQPDVFRDGANPGFHDAIGDALALSASTPDHLKKIHLLDDQDGDEETEINVLMKTALDKVVFLPFGYLIDAYRWKMFSGEITEDELNLKWWEHRLKYQGVCPPVRRTNEDFDATSKHHVIADLPYIRYFVSYIIQFQFHKGLCEAANHTGPLNHCDIYQNKEAGRLLSETLKLGSRVPWSEAMKIITRGKTSKMDAQPLLEYFEPLMKWLQKQNEGEVIGWKSNDPMMCPEMNNV